MADAAVINEVSKMTVYGIMVELHTELCVSQFELNERFKCFQIELYGSHKR